MHRKLISIIVLISVFGVTAYSKASSDKDDIDQYVKVDLKNMRRIIIEFLLKLIRTFPMSLP